MGGGGQLYELLGRHGGDARQFAAKLADVTVEWRTLSGVFTCMRKHAKVVDVAAAPPGCRILARMGAGVGEVDKYAVERHAGAAPSVDNCTPTDPEVLPPKLDFSRASFDPIAR